MAAAPRVFTIPAGARFLPTLADALLSGQLGALPDPASDPLALADIRIFLPTRRAARALSLALVDRLGSDAAILPRIRPIGDIDEDDLLLEPIEDPAERLVLPPAISRLDRQLILARFTRAWGEALKPDRLGLAEGAPVLIPASAADAFHLAGDLARLVDDVATAGCEWQALETLVPDDLARYWQITLDFLKIVGEAWPALLAERHLADPATRRDRLIRDEARRLASEPPNGLVIAAGSTGSIPATAELLATIARLPNGAVVLPDLDIALDDAAWTAIGGEGAASTPGHPQYGLKQWLGRAGIVRADVAMLGSITPPLAARARLVSEAMRPADTTEAWADAPPVPSEATEGLTLLVARNEQEEALALALALRESVETEGATAALVTPDRTIAARVAIELERFGLRVDDSAGRPLRTTPPGTLARLITAAARSDGAPLDLLALAKHPLAAFGMARADCRDAIGVLDLALFRGRLVAGGLGGLPLALERARRDAADASLRLHPAVKRLLPDDWDGAAILADRLRAVLDPLAALLAEGAKSDVATVSSLLAATLGAVLATEPDAPAALPSDEAGTALKMLLDGLSSGDAADFSMTGPEFPAFLDAAMAGVAVSTPPGADPRISIWGTLEARLQSADLVILAGLDEGVWPTEARTDPWLSRSMRAGFGLEAPERRLGQAAHDFTSALGNAHVIISRAERRGGAPTIAARWLQRLAARLGKADAAALASRGQRYLDWARALDASPAPAPVARPRPKPPVEARPKRLSVTEIETLVRDPYAIYARRVLKLEPLDPIDVVPDSALRGTLIHEALGRFAPRWQPPFDGSALDTLIETGRDVFRDIRAFPAVHALWWPRFLVIADWYVRWEAARKEIEARHAEIDGRMVVTPDFMLTGRADRIDRRRDGTYEILDFKTGTPPSPKQLSTGLAPQLALEAAMLRRGAFGDIPAGASVAVLGWIGLGRVGRGEPFSSAVRDRPADELGDEAAARLAALITAYADPDRAYVSRARPMFENRFGSPYDHLARVAEWALGEGDEA
ncbi:double-strand break repair protein AddB [Mesorhizobium sp. BR1-1-16]|uniref:double-strand break repair protein AddB n=1 Tax=Mesorhizobium sp. BR1-1-16 TaxID=2876653 RepID=UPI001CCD573A|nr:double-strand break repair protein AddB [Mesorhizobium sp. BR1-1-16]MBZ9938118.1 double-strand break repair protein AddB [Mesorhizobium sp. BR1-1-16]